MTEIKSAISIIENEKECVQSDCDRDCSKCKLVKEESEIVGAFDMAIRSLQTWEEVLQELKECGWDWITRNKIIDIIKQKLAEIEE